MVTRLREIEHVLARFAQVARRLTLVVCAGDARAARTSTLAPATLATAAPPRSRPNTYSTKESGPSSLARCTARLACTRARVCACAVPRLVHASCFLCAGAVGEMAQRRAQRGRRWQLGLWQLRKRELGNRRRVSDAAPSLAQFLWPAHPSTAAPRVCRLRIP